MLPMLASACTIPWCLSLMTGLGLSLSFDSVPARPLAAPRNIVFYYGGVPPVDALSRFDLAVVEPDTGFVPTEAPGEHTRWLAYASVGEVSRSRAYYASIPESWVVGRNTEWQSDIVDQAAAGWPDFFVEHVISPLWQKGYAGFFLDTLDSYQLVARDDEDRRRSQEGTVAVIRAIHERFPEAVLILNRGFELLPLVHEHVYAVAFESLFKSWSEGKGEYRDVPEDDRQWLLDRANEVREQYGLPVIAIDYCLPSNDQCSRQTVESIRALGMVPYVGDGRLQEVNFAALD